MKIVTDSAVDLPEEMFAQFGIERMPLLITFGTEALRSGVDIQAEEFYRRLEASKDNLPTTSQPSVGEFVDLYRRVGQTDKDIVSVHISSGLSGTLNSATQAAKQCPELNITLIDTKTLSAAEGFQVVAVAQAIRRGYTVEQIVKRAQEVGDQTEIFFTLDTLYYLQKGGRIGRVQAMAGRAVESEAGDHGGQRAGHLYYRGEGPQHLQIDRAHCRSGVREDAGSPGVGARAAHQFARSGAGAARSDSHPDA